MTVRWCGDLVPFLTRTIAPLAVVMSALLILSLFGHSGVTGDKLLCDTCGHPPRRSVERRLQKQDGVRQKLREIFRVPFVKVRIPWLRNPATGRCFELDMYNKALSLAFEYDGAQHEQYTPHLHRNSKLYFEYRGLLDKLKDVACRDNGVKLVCVPYTITAGTLSSFLDGCASTNPVLKSLIRNYS